MKKFFTLLLIAVALVSCDAKDKCLDTGGTYNKETKQCEFQTKVSTSILPLASLVNTIWGEYVSVNNIVGAGKSPHGFDLKPSHLIDIKKSEAVVMIGMDHIDGFLEKSLKEKNTLRLEEGIERMEMWAHTHEHEEHETHKEHHEDEDTHEADHHDKDHDSHEKEEHHEHDTHHNEDTHEEHDEHEHGAHEQDPHIWNSPKNAELLAKKIATFLGTIDSKNKKTFETNATTFVEQMQQLVTEFKKNTRGKEQQYFIVFHDAHNYLLRDLEIDADKKLVFRKSVLNEPNSNDMKDLIDEIEEHQVKIAFVEPQFQNTNFEKLAKKYEIEVFTLDPLGTDEAAGGYMKNMTNNLKSLEKIFQ